MMSYLSALSLRLATGIILFAKRKATPLRKIVVMSKGRMKRIKGIPADFIATSSKVSPRLPNVMIEERSNASGNASGTQVIATRPVR